MNLESVKHTGFPQASEIGLEEFHLLQMFRCFPAVSPSMSPR